jgi:hypothetical protein
VIVLPEKTLGGRPAEAPQKQVTYVRAPRGRFDYSDQRGRITFHLESDPALDTPEYPEAGTGMLYKVILGDQPLDFEKAEFVRWEGTIKVHGAGSIRFIPHKAKHLTTAQLIMRVHARAGREPPRPETAGLTPDQKEYQLDRWAKRKAQPRGWKTEIHKRSALSMAPLLLGAVAVPLGVMTRRGRRLLAFAIAIAVMLGGYYPLMAMGTKLGESGRMPPAAAVWLMNGLVAVLGIILIRNMLRR